MYATQKPSCPSLSVLPHRVQAADSPSTGVACRPSLEAWPPGRGPLQEASVTCHCPCPALQASGPPPHWDSLDAAEHNLGEGVDQGLKSVGGADGAEDAAPQLQAVHELPVVYRLVCLLQGAPKSTGSPGPSPSSEPGVQAPASCAPPNPTAKTLPQPGHTPSCAWSWRCAGGWRAGGCTGTRADRRHWCPAPAARSASAA